MEHTEIKNFSRHIMFAIALGFSKVKGKGHNIQHLKTQGSKKINGYCPASISLNSVNGT